MTVSGLSRSLIRDRTWNVFMDAIVFAGLFATGYAIVAVARYWFSVPVAAVDISAGGYSALCVLFAGAHDRRLFASLVFAIGYGYFAAYNKRVEGPCSLCSTSCNPFRS